MVSPATDNGRLHEMGRITVNVDTAYRGLDPNYVTPDVVEQFRRMAAMKGFQFA